MANYHGTARTNFFHVKDEAAASELKQWCYDTGNQLHKHPTAPLCFMVSGTDDGGGFSFWKSADDEDDSAAWWDTICHVMANGEILVAIEAGAEKLRYVTGSAVAITNTGNKGGYVGLSLDNIYDMAEAAFGVRPVEATYTKHSGGMT